MKKLMMLAATLCMTSAAWAGTTRENVQDRLDNAGKVLHEVMAAPDAAFRKKFWITQSA